MRNWHGNLSPFGQWHTGGRAFTPAFFFASGEPGVWLDPSDTANLAWRRNLLTFTEQFDNAAWGKTAAGVAIAPTVTANAGIAPDGTTTADRIQFDCTNTGSSANRSSVTQNFTATTGVSYTSSIYIRAFDAGNVGRTVRITSDFIGTTVYTLTADWQRVVIGGTSSGTGSNLVIETRGTFTQQTADILLWGAQLEVGSTASTYQVITDLNTEVRANFPNATLYQDTAGTTPVTTPGQSVALALDKSRGLVLGANVATVSSVTGVAAGGPAFTNYTISPAMVVGRAYEISFTVSGYSGSGDVGIAGAGASFEPDLTSNVRSSDGTIRVIGIAATSTVIQVYTRSTNTANFSNISVRELPGNHATQATSGSRPLYALLPANGVRNLANGSADPAAGTFWLASGTSNGITATKVGSGLDSDGLPYADYSVSGTATAASNVQVFSTTSSRTGAAVGQTYTCSALQRLISGTPPGANNGVRPYFDGETAPSTFVEFSTPAQTGATTVESTLSSTYTLANAATNQVAARVTISTQSGVTVNYTVRIKALQLELGSTRTAYQFNYSNVNIAQPPFAQVGALLFDGVDDFLQTPSVDFAGYEQLGSELVTNGDFAGGTTGWSLIGTGSARAVVAGEMEVTATAGNFAGTRQTISGLTIGTAYRVTGTARQGTTTNIVRVQFGTVSGDVTTTTNTPVSLTFIATATSHNLDLSIANAVGNGTAYFDNISVKEVLRPADKMTVFAGVRKLSDAARAIVAELGNNTTGSFRIEAPGSSLNNFAVAFGGSAVVGTSSASSFSSPISSVISGAGDISGDIAVLRVNGTQVGSNPADQGTGNYRNDIIYICRRGGTTLPFNGYLFSLIVRGAATPEYQIRDVEAWVNSRTGAY